MIGVSIRWEYKGGQDDTKCMKISGWKMMSEGRRRGQKKEEEHVLDKKRRRRKRKKDKMRLRRNQYEKTEP